MVKNNKYFTIICILLNYILCIFGFIFQKYYLMMYKRIFLYFLALFLLVWYSFSQNYNQIDANFWNKDYSSWDIYSLIYENDFYTETWSGYNKWDCDINLFNIVEITEFPNKLENNTIYVLNTWIIFVNNTLELWDCTSILSKDGTLIDNTYYDWDIFVINWRYSIIDNIKIRGEKKDSQYGIKLIDTHSITLNNIQIDDLYGWIYSKNSNNSKYNDINLDNIYDYSLILKNSHNNYLSGIKSSNCIDGAWIHIESSDYNTIYNIESFKNKYQWLYLKYANYNNIVNINSHSNFDEWIRIRYWSENELSWIITYWNALCWLTISSTWTKINSIVSYENAHWIKITSSNNEIGDYYTFNNISDWIYISWWIKNWLDSGFVFNNKKNWIELENSSKNNFSKLKTFNNWIIDSWIAYCWIRLYNNSSSNNFSDILIYNNIIGICLNTNTSWNKFEDMMIFNNRTTESNIGNLSWTIIKTWIIINTWILQKELTWKIKTWISEILTWSIITKTGLKLSFEYMVNPHVKKHYLISWESSYADNIWFKSDFLDINDDELTYSIGMMLQNEVKGHIISNWVNVVSDWDINTYNINGHEYVGNKLRNTLSENINIWDVRNTVATNINGKDIHAMLILDTASPTCKITYSTTWTTTDNVIAYLTWCSEEIQWTETIHIFTKSWSFTFEFTDLVWNSGYATATVNRIIQKPSWWGWWGGGGWWWNWWWNNDLNQSNNSWNNTSETKFSFDQSKFDANYSDEMNMAYQYAYYHKITTQKSIQEAAMDDGLTRIAMAKMLSYYAINVLKKTPDRNKYSECLFDDITPDLMDQYDNWWALSCQLWIMGIWIEKFRPFDSVTRAEFATALSRLLYGTKDWEDVYYSTHLKKLFDKWIIVNTDPDLKELRWYVMIMLMRSALWISSTEDFVYPEPEPQSQEIMKYFTEPYKKGQIYSRIWDLQDLLRYLGYYKLWTNYVYSKATINAVYDFQVAMWLIDADDVNNPARWYLWPETRNALNEKWAEFQQYKNWIANE